MIYKPSSPKWTLPIAVSILLHATIVAVATLGLPGTDTTPQKTQTLTVELLNLANISSPVLPTANRRPAQKPQPEDVKPEPPQMLNNSNEAALSNPPQTEQTITEQPASSTSTNASPSSLNIQPLSKLSRPPSFLRKIEPVYPRAEQRAGSQAYVLAEVTINEQGTTVEVKIMKSAGIAFDNAVIEALQKSTFAPGYIGQNAVAVRVMVPFRFNLK